MMTCPEKEKIATYLDGEMQDTDHREQISKHIQSCTECQKWVETYEVMQQVGDEINLISAPIPEFQMTPALEAAIAEHEAHESEPGRRRWWEVFVGWKSSLQMPALAVGGALVLLIIGVFVWTVFQNPSSPTPFGMGGVTYRAWGVTESLGSLLDDAELPPALQSPQVSRYLGFLTPALTAVLQRPKLNPEFWKALSDALAEQKIAVPSSLRTLIIQDSLLKDIQATQDWEIWILFYPDDIMLIRWATEG